MPPAIRNLLAAVPPPDARETVEILSASAGTRVERITSHGHASPPGFWYDQNEDEFVLVLSGHATLEFEDGSVDLKPGDSLLIPARCRHRVAATAPDTPTLWLTVFHPPA